MLAKLLLLFFFCSPVAFAIKSYQKSTWFHENDFSGRRPEGVFRFLEKNLSSRIILPSAKMTLAQDEWIMWEFIKKFIDKTAKNIRSTKVLEDRTEIKSVFAGLYVIRTTYKLIKVSAREIKISLQIDYGFGKDLVFIFLSTLLGQKYALINEVDLSIKLEGERIKLHNKLESSTSYKEEYFENVASYFEEAATTKIIEWIEIVERSYPESYLEYDKQ